MIPLHNPGLLLAQGRAEEKQEVGAQNPCWQGQPLGTDTLLPLLWPATRFSQLLQKEDSWARSLCLCFLPSASGSSDSTGNGQAGGSGEH